MAADGLTSRPTSPPAPTTDFARENIFNVIENLVDFEEDTPDALDLFAGTGAVSFELLSRGCRSVTLRLEKAATQANFIRKVASQLGPTTTHCCAATRSATYRPPPALSTSYSPTLHTTCPASPRFQAKSLSQSC